MKSDLDNDPSNGLKIEFLTVGAFAENSYVVGCGSSGAGVLIDPGGEVPSLLQAASDMGLRIEAIWLTHAHLDHVLGLHDAVAATGAPVVLHPDDRSLYEAVPQQGQAFGFPVEPLPEPDGWFETGETRRLGELAVEVLHVPGHSPGHVAFWFPSSRALISGDVLFAGSIGRTDLPGGSYETLMRTIREVLVPLGDDVRVYPGHGPATTVGTERRSNPFLLAGP
jgi:glyoxylase-like metal-dependent hydrolase (beta-lactamase superfamily II)